MSINSRFKLYVLIISINSISCSFPDENKGIAIKKIPSLIQKKDSVKTPDSCGLERLFVQKNLINISSLDSNIRVVLHYSTSQNFLKKPLYNGLTDCYLPCEVAIKLCNAQHFLNSQFPKYHLIVFDAVRPLHIQKQMWDEFEMPDKQKINYLAHPKDISLHNYGAAVDVSIIGPNNVLLDMGTPFDFFGELSEPKKEQQFLLDGSLSKQAYANRQLLRKVMLKAGFMTITTEWWHFNADYKKDAAKKYELIQ